MLTPIQLATFKFVAERRIVDGRHQTVDLREISEPMRQRIIDLAMMDPPLIGVDGPRVVLSGHGYILAREIREIHSSDGGVESQTRKEPSAEREQSLIAAGPKDPGVAPGPSEGHSARIEADRLWRMPDARKRFETETGLTDEMTEAYQSRFRDWATQQ